MNSESYTKTVQNGRAFLEKLLGGRHPRNFAVRLWDGSLWGTDPGQPVSFTLALKHPGALRSMFWPPNQLTLGEAYIYDDYDIEGDIHAAFALADHLVNLRWGMAERIRYGRYLLTLPQRASSPSGRRSAHFTGARHSRQRDRQAVTYHYNVSNDFYRLWLDSRMVYSCGYFASAEEGLDQAQERKLDYICRKLRLKSGERFLDIGCGWGSLLMHAVQNYGVEALGITISEPQADLANERIRLAGLEGRCRVEVCDYRELEGESCFDKMASIGMFEHVGKARLKEYFDRAWRLLRPGGVFLNHGIASSLSEPFSTGPSFIDSYVFPDGELLPVNTTLGVAGMSGFEARDLESLREHYALTLRHWCQRLEAARHEICRITDEPTYRTWRLYMAGSAHAFDRGQLNIYQSLLSKPDNGRSDLPLTRGDWYY